MHFRRQLPLLIVLSMVAVPMARLRAQTIRGQLVDELNGLPIDRAFVVLLDTSRAEVARVITDRAGDFSIGAPKPGDYVLRTERIGFRSTETDVELLRASETRQLTIRIAQIVVRLDLIEVTGEAKECRVQGEHGLATATVWEEARKVLAAIVWGGSQRYFTYHTRTYKRRLDRQRRVENEIDSVSIGTRVVLFRSRPAGELQEHGYAEIRPDSFFYYAPDAAAFFSDAFLSQHCFNLRRDDEHPNLIGLEFDPLRGRRLPDVSGILWLDEESAELRHLDLRYTNLGSRVLERNAEGRVDFDRLPSGPWFVSSWWIRMPLVDLAPPDISSLQRRPREVLRGFDEDGGEVVRVVDGHNVVVWERR